MGPAAPATRLRLYIACFTLFICRSHAFSTPLSAHIAPGMFWSLPSGRTHGARSTAPVSLEVSVDGSSNGEPTNMRVAQIKAELKERRINFDDCFDKESLAEKLVQARAGLISSPPPPPPPRGAARGDFEFGAETRQDEEMSMDEAFKAAGWTGQTPSDPSKVDKARSPGMSRNFGDVDISDFKKPFSRGQQ